MDDTNLGGRLLEASNRIAELRTQKRLIENRLEDALAEQRMLLAQDQDLLRRQRRDSVLPISDTYKPKQYVKGT